MIDFPLTRARRLARRLSISAALALIAGLGLASGVQAATTAAPVGHVFIIVLENENALSSFGPNSPAPYLSQTLPTMGAFLPRYYGIGHASLDNYVAMISGQPPNVATQADCDTYRDFKGTAPLGPLGINVGQGCVHPASTPTIASQLQAANISWKAYMEDMGNDPQRESATCGHPVIGTKDDTQSAEVGDQYAARHDPFVYFHSIIDDSSGCDAHVVNFSSLQSDLLSTETTAHYVFITPNLCDDGHDSPCVDGGPGGLEQADQFLQTWVPRITASPAWQQDGLLIVLFDESGFSAKACCNEQSGPNTPAPGEYGPGGGRTGAVLLSPFIQPGTVSYTAYNHYSLLRTVEDFFGLSHLGEAGAPGLQPMGADVFTAATPTASKKAR